MKEKNCLNPSYSLASVFDLDHTLLKTNSSLRFGFYLKKQGVITTPKLFQLFFHYLRHKLFKMSVSELHFRSLSLIEGCSLDQIKKLSKEFVKKFDPSLINQEVLQCLKQAIHDHHYVIIASNSPSFLVDAFAEKFGAMRAIGVDVPLNENCQLNGEMPVQDGPWKRDRVITEIEKLSIPANRVVAYSDSMLDYPLLKAVGRAIAVNPDRLLRKESLRNGWKII